MKNNIEGKGKRSGKSEDIFYMNQFYDTNIQSTLTSAEAQVYGAYLRYSNGGKDKCFPSQDKLSENLGLSVRTIARALDTLRDKGYIILLKRGNDRTGSSIYVVKTPFELGFKVARDDDNAMSVAAVKALAPKAKTEPKKPAVKKPQLSNNAMSQTAVTEPAPGVAKTAEAHEEADRHRPETMTSEMIMTVYSLANQVYALALNKQYSDIISTDKNQWVSMLVRKDRAEYQEVTEYLNYHLEALSA